MDNEIPNDPVQEPSDKKKIIIAVGISVALIAASLLLISRFFGKTSSVVSSDTLKKIIPTPTLYPFQELTIPYLRNKTYKSAIENKQLVSQNGQYSKYLATYQSEGFKINALLTEPAGEMPEGGWPAIVFIHGYIPPSLYETDGQAYSSYVDYLARNGYVVFKIDLRGHGTSEGRPGGGYYGADYVTDTLNAYNALQNADFVNPNKIGIWGHSMAGNITLRSLAVKKDIPVAVIWAGAVYSYVDREKYGIQDNSYRPPQDITRFQGTRARLGNYDGTKTFWQEFVPTNYLNDIKTAIQLDHAVDDTVVNIGYSRDLTTLLDKTAIPHEFHEYPSGGHNISGSSYNEAMANTVAYFDKYIK